ncbi:MAG TPA: thioesterase family protein [Burkholderiaceae bacterium]|nr:thioesterase family protein [Burkholderiaceae bacterium]
MTASQPAARRSAEEQQRLDAALAELFERRITFNQSLGLRVESARHPQPRIRFDMRPELIGHYQYGRLHGGVISAALDAMGGFALMVAIGDKHADETTPQVLHRFAKMGTIDLRIDYLRPGVGAHFLALAEVTRLGGRIGSTQMRLVNDQGILIATGAAAYVIS